MGDTGRLPRKLAVILHADVVGSTELVRRDEALAHERIQDAFVRLSTAIAAYGGTAHEVRGDALVAEFDRASDAVCAALDFQARNTRFNTTLYDEVRPELRIGIALGEVIIDDHTLTGEGVVLAQRMEQLARVGAVCIQALVYEAVPGRFSFAFEDLGEQEIKGFPKPVRAYAVSQKAGEKIPAPERGPEATAVPTQRLRKHYVASGVVAIAIVVGVVAWLVPWQSSEEETASIEKMVFPLPDRPSIAVLPFANMSDDPKQKYFVDGMTEDLITDISKISGLFVIARNTVFAYKGGAVKIAQVAEELGVRYVLEGSVRRAGDQIRINAQLIDATTGGHLWAERYDASLNDVFALQDKITQKIVTALSVKLTPEEKKQRVSKYTNNTHAYDAFLQGWNLWSYRSPEEFSQTVQFFEKAIELDSDYGHAYAALALFYLGVLERHATKIVGISRGSAWDLMIRYIKQALKQPTPLAHRTHAEILTFGGGRWDQAIAAAERSISLNSNDPDGYEAMGELLVRTGNLLKRRST